MLEERLVQHARPCAPFLDRRQQIAREHDRRISGRRERGGSRVNKHLAHVGFGDRRRAGHGAGQRAGIRGARPPRERLHGRHLAIGGELQRALEADGEYVFLEAGHERLVDRQRLAHVVPETLLELRVAVAVRRFRAFLRELIERGGVADDRRLLQPVDLHRVAPPLGPGEEPEPFVPSDPSFPQTAARIIGKLLQKEPAHRYQSAGDLVSDLDEIDTPTFPTSPRARGSSASKPICVGRSNATESPVWPCERR